jgi:hypothetical protein
MTNHGPDQSDTADELEIIEFQSPGRFNIENPPALAPAQESWQPAPFTLADTADAQSFNDINAVRAHALTMIGQARRSICIYTPDLEHRLYDHSSIQQVCTRFLLAHPRNRLRILISDPSRSLRNGHRLITLARRLTSNLQIRRRHPDYPAQTNAFLIADDCGLLIRTEADQFVGHALYSHPGRARQQQRHFDTAWDHSLSDPDFRSFLL